MKYTGFFSDPKTHKIVDTKQFEADGIMTALVFMSEYAKSTNTYCSDYKRDEK